MYAGQFGYTDTAGGASFNGAPHPRNPHMQPGLSQNLHQHQHHHQPRQQHQQIMYNAQQYPITSQAGTFSSGPSPAMLGGPGPAGAMRNAAMPHLAANNQMAFQTPYTTSPYGGNIPSPVAPQQQPQMPPNFMMTGSMPQYQMSAGQMQPQQQMMQRMHPSQQNAASMSPQLQYNNPQGTPTSMSTQQFPSTQAGGMAQGQTASNGMQSLPSATTPQTPTFPPVGHPSQVNGVSIATSPLSPASESREKERFGIILEINQELLLDSLQMQNTRAELKKELATEWSADKKAECEEQDKLAQVDYQQCMRRLQGNLSYMASLADKKSVHSVPHPAHLTPPSLSLKIKLRGDVVMLPDPTQPHSLDPQKDREERDRYLKELYKKLQSLFPGVDPKKEYASSNARPGAGQQPSQAGARGQNGHVPAQTGSNHSSPVPGPQMQRTPQMANAAVPMMQGQSVVS